MVLTTQSCCGGYIIDANSTEPATHEPSTSMISVIPSPELVSCSSKDPSTRPPHICSQGAAPETGQGLAHRDHSLVWIWAQL